MADESVRMYEYRMLELAHRADDLQYGFGAVLANLPLIRESLASPPE